MFDQLISERQKRFDLDLCSQGLSISLEDAAGHRENDSATIFPQREPYHLSWGKKTGACHYWGWEEYEEPLGHR